MTNSIPVKTRSVYAGRFRALGEFTFEDSAAFEQRSRWRDWFENRIGPAYDGRAILEIGCFDASYLSRIAAKHPTTAFIGLDWKYKALYTGARQITTAGLRNVALIRARAQDAQLIFTDAELDEIWLFHPDPCDRPIELKNRLVSEAFLLDAHRLLRDGTSTFTLKTDHPGYYQWALALLGVPEPSDFRAAPRIRTRDLMPANTLPLPSAAARERFEVTANSPDYWHDPTAQAHTAHRAFAAEPTPFESRFLTMKQPIYFLELRKR